MRFVLLGGVWFDVKMDEKEIFGGKIVCDLFVSL